MLQAIARNIHDLVHQMGNYFLFQTPDPTWIQTVHELGANGFCTNLNKSTRVSKPNMKQFFNAIKVAANMKNLMIAGFTIFFRVAKSKWKSDPKLD